MHCFATHVDGGQTLMLKIPNLLLDSCMEEVGHSTCDLFHFMREKQDMKQSKNKWRNISIFRLDLVVRVS